MVIDDGSHINKLTLPTFYTTFPYVARGGLYFIEDMQARQHPWTMTLALTLALTLTLTLTPTQL